MLQLQIHHTIFSLEEKWKSFDPDGIYQSYEIQKCLFWRLPVYALKEKYIPRYIEILDDNVCVLIAPLCKYIGRNDYCFIGDFNGFQIYDFIYSKNLTPESLEKYISFLLSKLSVHSLHLNYLPDSCLTLSALSRIAGGGEYTARICPNENVNICVGNDYEKYAQSLSKSTRQNIRTAYNRLHNSDIDFRLDLSVGTPIKRRTLNQLIDVYCTRHDTKYGVHSSFIKKFYLKYFDFSTAYQQKNKNNFCAVLYFKNQIAAFMTGIVQHKDSRVIIPRLSIVGENERYSPGIILINETAKKLERDCGILNLDLSKGSERYKIAMGGTIYYTYKVKLEQHNT